MTRDEIARRWAAVTPGDWRWEEDRVDQPCIYAGPGTDVWVALLPHQCLRSLKEQADLNAEAIANAPRDLAYLLGLIAALERERDELKRRCSEQAKHIRSIERVRRMELDARNTEIADLRAEVAFLRRNLDLSLAVSATAQERDELRAKLERVERAMRSCADDWERRTYGSLHDDYGRGRVYQSEALAEELREALEAALRGGRDG